MKTKNLITYITLVFTILVYAETRAQTFQSGQTVLNNGSVSAVGTSFQTQAIIGQPAISTINSTNFQLTTGFGPAFLSVKPIDVAIENIVLSPTTVGAGNSLDFTFDITSLETGSIVANKLEVGIYLSTDQVIDSGELLKTITVANAISGSATYAFPQAGDDDVISISAGTAPGNYYLIFALDPNNSIGETNEANNELASALTVSDDLTPPVIGVVSKDNFYATGSTASVSVNDNVGVGTVNFYHRGIRASNSSDWGPPVTVPLVSGVYSVTLEASWLDELGVEFWFEAFDSSNNRDSTTVHYTYYQTAGNELTLPNFPAGRNQSNYRIFSIPFNLTQKNAISVFAKLGNYDPTKWRMYHYLNGSTKEFNQGWSSIEPGKSYWLIHDIAGVGQMLIGEGKTTQSNKTSPYTISLIQGWNQIGNPYRFDIDWTDVLAASGSPTEVERFRVWNAGSFSDGTSLSTFGGGFVFTSAPVTITIPVTTSSGGRIAEDRYISTPLDNESWQITFQITNSDLSFDLGGFGMHPDALNGKDYYDDVAMPRLPEYLDMNFSHPEYFISRFNKDIVPTAENNIWEFTIDKNSAEEFTSLSWDNSFYGDNSKAIYLVDIERNSLVNMRDYNSYSFQMLNQYRFKVVFGDESNIEKDLIPSRITLGQNYPNPFTSSTLIPIALPDGIDQYNVELVIINKLGQEVTTLFSGNLNPGYQEFEWNGSSKSGQKMTSGIYVCRLRVNTGSEVLSYAKHILIY